MKSATLSEVKKELATLPPAKVFELCMRVAKYKKENKELLNYLLFEAHDEDAYIKNIKAEIDFQYALMNRSTLYLAKKSTRKILRTANKFIKYSGNKKTEVELRIYFCEKMKKSGILQHESVTMMNLYTGQLKRINSALATLHEDLQYDYKNIVEKLS